MHPIQRLLRYLPVASKALLFSVVILVIPAMSAADPGKVRPVSRAACGTQDRLETVQGQTTMAERFVSGTPKPYACNLELVGQFEGEGAGFAMQVFGSCAYYSTWPSPSLRRPGVVVLDMTNVRDARATTWLDSPVMRDVGESLTVSHVNKLLLGSRWSTTPTAPLEIYDLSIDCRNPVLKSQLSLPGLPLHAGQFTPDGRTFYGALSSTDPKIFASGLFALDTSDAANPHLITTWMPPHEQWKTHAVAVSKDGTRAYVSLLRTDDDSTNSTDVNGLVILDIAGIQARHVEPRIRIIGTHFWDDTHFAQFPLPIRVLGRPYLVFTDLAGAIGQQKPTPDNVCASGKPGHGFARIIDISDEHHPKTVSKLMLEVQAPDNCLKVMHDPAALFKYGSLGCDVDDIQNAKLLACAYFEGGLRVFDIRNPQEPREVAYYKPPARRTDHRPASLIRSRASSVVNLTADQVVVPKFRNDKKEIAFISFDNGFQVVRFTDRFRSLRPELF